MLSQIKYNDWAFNILYLILMLSTVHVQCIRNQNSTAGIIRNLSVSVFQDYSLDNNAGIFKFNISWLPPANGRPPTSYSILVSSISNEETENKTSCPRESLYHTTQDGNEFQVSLPERKFLSEISELNIQLRCSYKIQVFANPRTNSIQTPSRILTVPECVGLTCSCQESQKLLPVPKIETKFLSSGDILIEWKTNSNDSGVHAYSISFGLLLLVSKNGLPVYKKTKVIKLPSTNSSFLWKKEVNLNDEKSIKESTIFVTAEDIRGCQGNEGSARIDFPKMDPIIRGNITPALLGIMGICILLISAMVFLCLRSRKAYNAILFEKNLTRSRRIDLVLQNRNILYVEQEIEEANKKLNHDKYKVDYNNVKIKKELGRGQFGRVYLANLQGRETPVAVKMSVSDPVHKTEARKHLLEEIETIKAAGPHPHLVGLIGYCISPKNPICLLLEYEEGGDLLSYLQSLRDTAINFEIKYSNISNSRPSITKTLNFGNEILPLRREENNLNVFNSTGRYTNIGVNAEQKDEIKSDQKFVERNLFLCFALQIALGMEHLESKMIIHRDLAARNILIDSNFNLKISDFGLSRNGVYVMGSGMGGVRRLPIRWMSPETLRERAFSSKSDVWSFAVVLWEIGTLGMFPYANLQDDDLLKYILGEKGRLPRPENMERDIFNIMNICWASKPEKRPSFAELVSWFSLLAEPGCSDDNNIGKSNPCYSLLTSSNRNLQS